MNHNITNFHLRLQYLRKSRKLNNITRHYTFHKGINYNIYFFDYVWMDGWMDG